MLPVTDLQVDEAIRPRESLNTFVIDEYATLYREEEGDAVLPPLAVFQVDGTYYVADGFHRLEAARWAKKATLPCQVHAGSRRDAMIYAIFANLRRGFPYGYGDKQRILERLLGDAEHATRSDRALARDVGVSHVYVWRIRARLTEHRRLQETLATLPTTTRGARAQAEEQLATYLEVPRETLQQALHGRGQRPDELVMDLAKAVETSDVTPEAAREKVQAQVLQHAKRAPAAGRKAQPPRSSRSKEAQAQRQAAREEHARVQAEQEQRWERQRRASAFTEPLSDLVGQIYPLIAREPVPPILAIRASRYTLPEMVEAIADEEAPRITERLQQARVALEALEHAWQARQSQRATNDAP